MDMPPLDRSGQEALEQVLGYLNFGSGAPDPRFLCAVNLLYAHVENAPATGAEAGRAAGKASQPVEPTWRVVGSLLEEGLLRLRETSSAFRDAEQAGVVLRLVLEHVLPGYLRHHRDLLFHQTDASLFRPFFFGRVCETVLQIGPPWDPADRIARDAIARLCDYVGHRPVATLRTHKHEPYPHEWVRPIPLYVRGAGVGVGRYHDVVEQAISLLEKTDEDILREAFFDPALLEELAVDPRAYDFDHPVNKRPNYHFGQWDPHHIDNDGRYRRFVMQQVTLDALLERLGRPGKVPYGELLFEAAAVLAGTILMASGISGAGPNSHDSTTSLVSLLPGIAAYRDAFYHRLLGRLPAEHAARLRAESERLQQPFGAARQHLNAQLSRRRAAQLEHVRLAKVFARMGYPEAAAGQADVVPVASARILCRIACALAAGNQLADAGRTSLASEQLPKIMDLLHRGIECGAVVDPWNALGLDAHYNLFPAPDSSVHDHRIDELVDLFEAVFALYARLWGDAAAANDGPLCERIAREFRRTTEWCHRFALHEVGSVDASNAVDVYNAAERVAESLNLWHQAGAAAGDVRFWAPHAEMFDSPKSYAMVIDALLERGDFVASSALLVHWLGRADRIGLHEGDDSFYDMALRWMTQVGQTGDDAWTAAEKLLDRIEANADEYWQVPEFQWDDSTYAEDDQGGEEDRPGSDAGEDGLFSAAYENVVYRDSTDDGFQGDVFDTGRPTENELEQESRRIHGRLSFLVCLARLWKLAAGIAAAPSSGKTAQRAVLLRWFRRAETNRGRLIALLDAVWRHPAVTPTSDPDALIEYDRRRTVKEMLLERIIGAVVEAAETGRFVLAVSGACAGETQHAGPEQPADELPCDLDPEQRQAVLLSTAILAGDAPRVRACFAELVRLLRGRPLLYRPISKGGDPRKIVAARLRQRTLRALLAWLPRLGLLTETRRLIEAARLMEQQSPAGPGAVTEFDELFEIGYKALVRCVAAAAENENTLPQPAVDAALVACLEQMTQSMIEGWLAHSHTLRLSVLERVGDRRAWKTLAEFIQTYGGELFTQRFLHLANLRAILHQGVQTYLQQLAEDPNAEGRLQLLADLDERIPRGRAVRCLTTVLEAIVENYAEYRDYNATTTQSDRGEMLYTLLDFLRLRARYDRVAWNLKPVIMAHEVLVRRGRIQAAEMWRRALAERFGDEAERFVGKLRRLQRKYAMQMPTVAERIAERFVLPVTIDRICSLVERAVSEATGSEPSVAFKLLEHETATLARVPTGVGFDPPAWLAALEEEVQRVGCPAYRREDPGDLDLPIPERRLSLEQVQEQLDRWQSEIESAPDDVASERHP